MATDQQTAGLELAAGHRPRHARRGSASACRSIDDTLYDAFGQRQVAATYAQAQPVPRGAGGQAGVPRRTEQTLQKLYVRSQPGGLVPLSALDHHDPRQRCPPPSTTRGSSPRSPSPSTSRPGSRSATRSTAIHARRARDRLPASVHAGFQGTAQAFQQSLASEPLLILAALLAVYIVLGMLYESFIHPITILSTLPSAGVGALLALLLSGTRAQHHRAHRHHPAHRHREEERDHDDRLRHRGRARGGAVDRGRRSTRPACCASGRS